MSLRNVSRLDEAEQEISVGSGTGMSACRMVASRLPMRLAKIAMI